MSHPSRPLAVLAAIALAGTALPALAEQLSLSATLSAAEEVPPNDSPATGSVEATYDTDTNILDYTISYSGLTGEATAAHFHGPAAPGENAPPVVPIEPPLASPIAGTVTLTDAQETELLGGLWYFNVHTAQYPNGEIRGQVLQSAASGEVSTLPAESSMASSEEILSSSSSSADISTSVSMSASASVDPSVSLSVDPSVSMSASASASVSASVSAP